MSVSVEDNELFDFRGFRLDWFRLQVCTEATSTAGVVGCGSDFEKVLLTKVWMLLIITMVMSSGVCGDGGRDDYSLDAMGSWDPWYQFVELSFTGLHKCEQSWPGVAWPPGSGETHEHSSLPHKDGGLSGWNDQWMWRSGCLLVSCLPLVAWLVKDALESSLWDVPQLVLVISPN